MPKVKARPSRLSSGQTLNRATATMPALRIAKKPNTSAWSPGLVYVSTGARNPPTMPSTARARESWDTQRTPAPAVITATIAMTGAAGTRSWTPKAAYAATCSTAIAPPCRLSPKVGRLCL